MGRGSAPRIPIRSIQQIKIIPAQLGRIIRTPARRKAGAIGGADRPCADGAWRKERWQSGCRIPY
jgi:hypothetical protein